MKLNIVNNGYSKHGDLLFERIAERIPVDLIDGGMTVELKIDRTVSIAESFSICGGDDKWTVVGSDELGLYFGIGKLLHTAVWSDSDFMPKATSGVVSADCHFRAMYFVNHLYNFYHAATPEAIKTYVDDMLLWGYNTILCIVPVITLCENDPNFVVEIARARMIFGAAKERGMKVGLLICVNQGFVDAPEELYSVLPEELTFRGDYGRNICTSNPAGLDYMRRVWNRIFEAFYDDELAYIVTWPYDEGGCGCKDCRPWGARGYLNTCIELKDEALKFYPNVKFIISTWAFDAPNDEGEFDGLYNRLTGDMSWADCLMIDAHNEYPRYPLEHEKIKPIVNFPEISMWALAPWGGYGANPLPERFQRIWNDSKGILDGGLPYSEGIYEDISKIQFSGYYWDKERHWTDTMSEYINYEFSSLPSVREDALQLMSLIEINHTRCAKPNFLPPDMEVANMEKTLATRIDSQLSEKRRSSWRWRILYIRAILDYKRYAAYTEYAKRTQKIPTWADILNPDEEAQDFYRELRKYYHCVPFNGKNIWTLPPLGGAISRDKILVPDRRRTQSKAPVTRGNEG